MCMVLMVLEVILVFLGVVLVVLEVVMVVVLVVEVDGKFLFAPGCSKVIWDVSKSSNASFSLPRRAADLRRRQYM